MGPVGYTAAMVVIGFNFNKKLYLAAGISIPGIKSFSYLRITCPCDENPYKPNFVFYRGILNFSSCNKT